ncbi:hypothetical protein ACILDT_06845 [Capnocytophaga canis]|uniref:hypothetical protein n=1 Tax=Capnocytophaga TaxID=1016 RepID=UPI0012FF67F6|nr:hypothetical protein [Capnocytophaga sp. H4358]
MKIVHLCLSSFYIDDYSYQENMLPKYHHNMGFECVLLIKMANFVYYPSILHIKQKTDIK